MYDSEMRKDCPMRGNLGNCSPVGGFCMNGVSDEICEAVHNAYYHGFYNALKEQEAVQPIEIIDEKYPVKDSNRYKGYRCGKCKEIISWDANYCPYCGRKVNWDD